MPDITCIGVMLADVVGKPIDALPERGKLALLERIELHTGGNAANTGLALAKLGVRTALLGKVGADGFGDFVVRSFEAAGIEAGGVVRDAAAATSATIVAGHGDGERSFLHYPGTNATLTLDDLDFGRVADSKIVHVAGVFLMPAFDGEPTAELLQQAQAAGVRTSLDTAWDSRNLWMERLRPCLPHLDYFLPSYEEAQMLAGGREDPAEIARVFLDLGAKCVGIKLGAQGCFMQAQGGAGMRIGTQAVQAVDTLGAGDSFVAGFLAGVLRGWELEQCARFANAVGGCCVQSLGATSGIRSFAETLALMGNPV